MIGPTGPMPLPSDPAACSVRPVAGFLARQIAFLIDAIVLYLAAWLLEGALRPQLLWLNPWLPWLGLAGGLAYFWIGDGPLSGGRTLGRAVMSLHAVDRAGRPLGHAAALRRALIKHLILWVYFHPEANLLCLRVWPAWAVPAAQVGIPLLMSVVLALVAGVALDPFKRGWHDRAAGSWVVRDPTPASFALLHEPPADPAVARRLVRAPLWTLVLWLVFAALLLVRPLRVATEPALVRRLAALRELQAAAPLDPFAAVAVFLPEQSYAQFLDEAVRQERRRLERQAATTGEDVPTTEALRADLRRRGFPDGRTVFLTAHLRHGPWRDALLTDPELAERARAARQAAWELARRMHETDPSAYGLAEHFEVLLIEPFQLLFHNKPALKAQIAGPADPTSGPLTIRPVRITPEGRLVPLDEDADATAPLARSGRDTP